MSVQRRLRNRTVFSSVFLVSLKLVPLPWRASNTLFRWMICSTVSSVGCLSRPLLTRSMRPPGTMSWLGRLSWKCTPVAQWNAHYAQFVGTLSNSNWSRVTWRSISYAQNVRKCLSCLPILSLSSISITVAWSNILYILHAQNVGNLIPQPSASVSSWAPTCGKVYKPWIEFSAVMHHVC